MHKSSSGYLSLYVGPMFSGKSSALLHDLTMYGDIGMKVLYINHSDDTRRSSGDTIFSTHNSSYDKISPKIAWEKVAKLTDLDVSKYDVIGIDEAQFFEDLYANVLKWVHEDSKVVICAGLDGDVFLRPFGHILELVPLCDKITKLTAKCYKCLEFSLKPPYLVDAPFTIRLSSSFEQKVVGGSELYLPVCRFHHKNHILSQ